MRQIREGRGRRDGGRHGVPRLLELPSAMRSRGRWSLLTPMWLEEMLPQDNLARYAAARRLDAPAAVR